MAPPGRRDPPGPLGRHADGGEPPRPDRRRAAARPGRNRRRTAAPTPPDLAALDVPFTVDDQTVQVHTSIGVCSLAAGDRTVSAETLLARAGGNRVVQASPDQDGLAPRWQDRTRTGVRTPAVAASARRVDDGGVGGQPGGAGRSVHLARPLGRRATHPPEDTRCDRPSSLCSADC